MSEMCMENMARLREICRAENVLIVEFLRLLVGILERREYAEFGDASLFFLCTKGLGLSCPAAGARVTVARLILRVPEVLEWLEREETNLTSLRLLAKVLTRQNASDVLQQARGCSTREVEALVARLLPAGKKKPDRFQAVGMMGEPSPSADAREGSCCPEGSALCNEVPSAVHGGGAGGERGDGLSPKGPLEVSTRISATLSAETMRKYERVRELLSCRGTGADLDDLASLVFEYCLEKNDPLRRRSRNDGNVRKERPATEDKASVQEKTPSRHIPDRIRREVWKRDGTQCTFVSPVTGLRCQEKHFLEIDHITPFARGGSTVEPANLRLLCRTHNQWQARKEFGDEFMADKMRRGSKACVRGLPLEPGNGLNAFVEPPP